MPRRRKPVPTTKPPELTPVVNIAMVTLVVFMLTASFVEPQLYMQSQIALLERGGQSQFPPDWTPPTPLPVLLNMDPATPAVFTAVVGGQQTSDPAQLAAMLEERRRGFTDLAGTDIDDVQVEISPARQVIWQHTLTVYEAALRAGFTNVTITPSR